MTSNTDVPAPVRQGGVSTSYKLGLAVIVLAALVVVGSLLKRHIQEGPLSPLSDAERAALIERDTADGKLIVHPELGFGFDHPGPMYFAASDVEAEMRGEFSKDIATQFYAYAEMKTGRLLFVSLSKRPRIDAQELATMVDNVHRLFVQKASTRIDEGASVKTVTREVTADRATVYKTLGGGAAHVRLGAWKSSFGRDSQYVVILVGVTMKTDGLADVISSFRLRAR